MKKIILLICVIAPLTSCKAKKSYSTSKNRQTHTVKLNPTIKPSKERQAIPRYAKKFNVTAYK